MNLIVYKEEQEKNPEYKRDYQLGNYPGAITGDLQWSNLRASYPGYGIPKTKEDKYKKESKKDSHWAADLMKVITGNYDYSNQLENILASQDYNQEYNQDYNQKIKNMNNNSNYEKPNYNNNLNYDHDEYELRKLTEEPTHYECGSSLESCAFENAT